MYVFSFQMLKRNIYCKQSGTYVCCWQLQFTKRQMLIPSISAVYWYAHRVRSKRYTYKNISWFLMLEENECYLNSKFQARVFRKLLLSRTYLSRNWCTKTRFSQPWFSEILNLMNNLQLPFSYFIQTWFSEQKRSDKHVH